MQLSKTNVRAQHLSGNAGTNQNKNFLELTDDIPRKVFYSENQNFEWKFSYAELLIKVLEKYDILNKIEFEFSKKDSINYLIYILEHHVQLIDGYLKYDHLKSNIDSGYDSWQKPISIYWENTKSNKLKSISLGVPDVEPDYIYAFFIKDIFKFKSKQMRIGYAYFLHHFIRLTPSMMTEDECDYYISLERELESYEDFEHDDKDDWGLELKFMKKNIELRKPRNKKLFEQFGDYSIEYYSEFLNYKPRDPELKKVHAAIVSCIETFKKPFHSNFVPSDMWADDGAVPFENFFRIFPEENECSSYEIEQIGLEAQNGVMPLESLLKITKSKVDFKTREENQQSFKTLCENMALISQYLYEKKHGKERN